MYQDFLNFDRVAIFSSAPPSDYAAEHFCMELNKRVCNIAFISSSENDADIIFETDPSFGRDEYKIDSCGEALRFISGGIRGALYCVGRFLRKCEKTDNGLRLVCDIRGSYSPYKKIRGHQLGYRTTPNTYDAWSYDDYERYYLDLMYFGVNTIEHIPFDPEHSSKNPLMKYDGGEFLIKSADALDRLDLDLSLWHPNYNGETDRSAAEKRKELYSKLSRLDYLFIPGGDPGDLDAHEFLSRCRAISPSLKGAHPNARLYVSAQAPHQFEGWGERFVAEIKKDPRGIDGVIYGPNHAMPVERLYDELSELFPLRFYPDITHNVRCEYPVHYDKNDWNYALCTCLGRECANPRSLEYRRLFKETERYFVGSVSYSEGVTDDVNKFLWSALEYDPDISAEEAVADYARAFFFGTDTDKISRLIFALEKNWQGAPENNESIDYAYESCLALSRSFDSLNCNWRFLMLYFRACCDYYIKSRFIFDLSLISQAKERLLLGDFSGAVKILNTRLPDECRKLRAETDKLAASLFELIGYQSDVEHYYADNPERGAVLDTIDLPVTDKEWLIHKAQNCTDARRLLDYFCRNTVGEGEYYFSVALDTVKEKQEGEPYFNFMGDRPDKNDGTLPTALFNIFDNFVYEHTVDGLDPSSDYVLRITYLDKTDPAAVSHRISVNGEDIYLGSQFGEIDEDYTSKYCKPGFVCASYHVPKKLIPGGRAKLKFSEPIMGVMFAEYSLRKS